MAQNPYLGLIQIVVGDPTVAPGVPGVPYEFLYRMDRGMLYMKSGPGDTDWTVVSLGARQQNDAMIFGNGADGDVTVPEGVTTTLTRTVAYRNLTVPGILNTFLQVGGYRVYVSETLELDGQLGVVQRNGGTGTGAGGAASATGELGGGAAGGGGGAGNGASAPADGAASGTACNRFLAGRAGFPADGNSNPGNPGNGPGQGGSGGNSTSTFPGAVGGRGGLITLTSGTSQNDPTVPPGLFSGRTQASQPFSGGSGGGGGYGGVFGGGGNGGSGGGGGGGGGVVFVFARRLVGSGKIVANGGNGGNGQSNTGAGGGGGGGGGLIVVLAGETDWDVDIELEVSGGDGGQPGGGANPGGGEGGRGADGFKALIICS